MNAQANHEPEKQDQMKLHSKECSNALNSEKN
jgi:hypothetical protein